MKKVVRNLLSLLLVCALVFGLGWWLRNDQDFFLVQETPVEVVIPEDHWLVAADLKAQLTAITEKLKRQNIWRINIANLKNELLTNNWIAQVQVQRRLPQQIKVYVELQEALLIYLAKDGQFIPINRQGQKMTATRLATLPDRPLVRDPKFRSDEKLVAKVSELFQMIPNQGELAWQNINEVDWQEAEGLTLTMIDGQKIHLGEVDIQTKGLQILRVFEYLKSQKIQARVIDASFNKKVVVRQR